MNRYIIKAVFTEFPLPEMKDLEKDTLIIPAVKGTILLKYGRHAYYFYDFAITSYTC